VRKVGRHHFDDVHTPIDPTVLSTKPAADRDQRK